MYREHFMFLNPSRKGLFFEGENGGGGGGDNAEDAVKKAAEKLELEKKETKKKAPEEKEIEPTQEELDELLQAQNLVKVLKDPAARKAFVQSLAEREGLTTDSTKKEKEKIVRTIESIVKEGLGEEYEVLSGRMQKMFTEFAEYLDDTKVKPVSQKLAAREENDRRTLAENGYTEAFKTYKEAESLKGDVEKLMDEFKPGIKADPQKYFSDLIVIAAARKGVTLTKNGTSKEAVTKFNSDKREFNRKDASSRLASDGADDGKVVNTKPMSLNEAIAEAAKKAEALLKK